MSPNMWRSNLMGNHVHQNSSLQPNLGLLFGAKSTHQFISSKLGRFSVTLLMKSPQKTMVTIRLAPLRICPTQSRLKWKITRLQKQVTSISPRAKPPLSGLSASTIFSNHWEKFWSICGPTVQKDSS